MRASTLSHKGKRATNQDLVLEDKLRDGSYLFAIIDGMGGYEHGEFASQLIAESIATYMSTVGSIDSSQIQMAINKSNLAVRQQNAMRSANMAATIGGVVIKGSTVTYFWVGDVKVFHFRNNRLIFESTAHSLVRNLIESGSITEPNKLSKYRHVVTRSIQGDVKLSQAEIQSNEFQQEKDILIVCSDGVHDLIDGLQLERFVHLANTTADLLAIFNAKLREEAVDNATIGIIRWP